MRKVSLVLIARWLMFVFGISSAITSLLLFFQVTFFLKLWLWPDATSITNIFMSGIFAAIATATLWVAVTQQYRAMLIGSLFLLIFGFGAGIHMLYFAFIYAGIRYAIYGALISLIGIISLGTLLISLQFPEPQQDKVPLFIKWSFALFALVLSLTGILMIFAVPGVYPWPLPDEVLVVYGWVFLGASTIYCTGWLRPRWIYIMPAIYGFGLYSLILIVPYSIVLLGNPHRYSLYPTDHITSLTLYNIVLLYSILVCCYCVYCYKIKSRF